MRRSDNPAVLTDEVARFQAEVRRLALAVVQAVVKQELDRRQAARPPAKRQPAKRQAVKRAPAKRQPTKRPRGGGPRPEARVEPIVEAAPTPATPPEPTAAPAPGGRKRVAWTREAIINELATWMLSGTSIDATFVTRHGPPGLVAASRRIFGRFDAALNVAALHVSKLYPDGPPER